MFKKNKIISIAANTHIHGSGFVKIAFIATNTFEIVKAGLHPSFKMSRLTLPSESTLQWYIRVLNITWSEISIGIKKTAQAE